MDDRAQAKLLTVSLLLDSSLCCFLIGLVPVLVLSGLSYASCQYTYVNADLDEAQEAIYDSVVHFWSVTRTEIWPAQLGPGVALIARHGSSPPSLHGKSVRLAD